MPQPLKRRATPQSSSVRAQRSENARVVEYFCVVAEGRRTGNEHSLNFSRAFNGVRNRTPETIFGSSLEGQRLRSDPRGVAQSEALQAAAEPLQRNPTGVAITKNRTCHFAAWQFLVRAPGDELRGWSKLAGVLLRRLHASSGAPALRTTFSDGFEHVL